MRKMVAFGWDLRTVFVSLRFSYRDNDTIFRILPTVHSHFVLHVDLPIRKHLDLSFHPRLLPSLISRQSAFMLVVMLTRHNQVVQFSTVVILGFQFRLYHVVVTFNLSFVRSNQPCFIVISKGRLTHLRHVFATGADEPSKCTTTYSYDLV